MLVGVILVVGVVVAGVVASEEQEEEEVRKFKTRASAALGDELAFHGKQPYGIPRRRRQQQQLLPLRGWRTEQSWHQR